MFSKVHFELTFVAKRGRIDCCNVEEDSLLGYEELQLYPGCMPWDMYLSQPHRDENQDLEYKQELNKH